MSPGRGGLVTLDPRELRFAELAKLSDVNGRDGFALRKVFTKAKPADHEKALSASQLPKVTWPNRAPSPGSNTSPATDVFQAMGSLWEQAQGILVRCRWCDSVMMGS
jgi:hypothetical protein